MDRITISKTLEAEHLAIIKMMNKACSYVMQNYLLDRLDVEASRDWEQTAIAIQQSYPSLLPIFDALHEDAYDDDNDDDCPAVLKKVEPEEERPTTLRNWILRICHVIRTVAFLKQPRLDFEAEAVKQDTKAMDDIVFDSIFDDTGEMRMVRVTCTALLNILQQIFTHDEFIEEQWEKWRLPKQTYETFVVEKALFFCPFSVNKGTKTSKKEEEATGKLRLFFDEAQKDPIDPLKLVPEMLYHPDVLLRLESLKLGCKLLQDANPDLQDAFRRFDSPTLNLQKAMAYQFHDFANGLSDTDNIEAMSELLKKIQNMCEGHNSELQGFIGEDLSIEEKDFATLLAEHQEELDDDDDDDQDRKEGAGGPANLVAWICTMAAQILDKMKQDQQWQASMVGRQEQYSLLAQLFDTAAEIVQGPSQENQRLLLEGDILLQVNQLWLRQRIDEFKFRDLIQDNEELFVTWMELLHAMRACEISVLRFVLSLLEEKPLDPEDPLFRQTQEAVIAHRVFTIRHMVEELDPKITCDKVITHWNLSVEGEDESFFIAPVQDDDEIVENDTAERIIRPKREQEDKNYVVVEQQDHCLEICFLCWALFEGVKQAPEFKTEFTSKAFVPLERKHEGFVPFLPQRWNAIYSKVYSHFNDEVTRMHQSKYLHFLFGRIEILRGPRLQKIFFLVPPAIRYLKDHALIKEWQDKCINDADRDSAESKLQSFSEAVCEQYVGFVKHQYMLSGKPFPLNAAGEVAAQSQNLLNFLTVIMTVLIALVYKGSYSETQHLGEYDVHYPQHWQVIGFTCCGFLHFFLCLTIVVFHMVSFSQWMIETGIEQWKEENPNDHQQLNGPVGLALRIKFFSKDGKLIYKMILAAISFLGLHFDFLFFSFHNLHVCNCSATLSKVFEALAITYDQVLGTVFLGFAIQYVFLAIGFLIFPKGYGFADMDTSSCQSLWDCLLAHMDYGNRSAPVWHHESLTWIMAAFDYMYNLFVILILAAIISGIIIDTFSSMRSALGELTTDQTNNCFICNINRSKMERMMVKFDHHVGQEHYMWSYARFLMYLQECKASDLNGPESFVKDALDKQDYQFYPIGRAISLDSGDQDEYQEKQLRVKDLEEFRGYVKQCTGETEGIMQIEREVKTNMKDSRESIADLQSKLKQLEGEVQKRIVEQAQQLEAQRRKQAEK